mmetsp:Transcript_89622/g.262018  ORF Transcript_89622/g.262018 Transcript_89622/m.262018 type:complete len:507 (-) Transcript_89622:351-1871(-)
MEIILSKVKTRYPDCPDLPPLPASAVNWSESDFEMFVASMGQIVPAGSGPEPEAELSDTADKAKHALFECAPRHAGSKSKAADAEEASGKFDIEVKRPTYIKGKATADACLVMSSSIYMADRAAEGLKIESILTKFDQCRAAALQGISGCTTSTLVDEYGVGILLSDIYFAVESARLPAVTESLDVQSEIDLPQLPMVPSLQRLVDSRGETVCTAIFGQLMVDLRTGMLSGNREAYNRVKQPCDEEFGRSLPTSSTRAVKQEVASKFSRQHPKQGKAFTPSQYLLGRYVVAPSDCDTYNTLYHPKVASVAEHASLSTGEAFCCEATTAFFCKFISTLPPGSRLHAHIFVRETAQHGTRVLSVFEKEGEGVALCTFAVYGGPVPGFLFQEEVQAVDKRNAEALVAWARKGVWKSPGACDLAALERRPEAAAPQPGPRPGGKPEKKKGAQPGDASSSSDQELGKTSTTVSTLSGSAWSRSNSAEESEHDAAQPSSLKKASEEARRPVA